MLYYVCGITVIICQMLLVQQKLWKLHRSYRYPLEIYQSRPRFILQSKLSYATFSWTLTKRSHMTGGHLIQCQIDNLHQEKGLRQTK